MKAEDKKLLYWVFKESSDFLRGYKMQELEPTFVDGVVMQDSDNVSSDIEVLVITDSLHACDSPESKLLKNMLAAIQLFHRQNCYVMALEDFDLEKINQQIVQYQPLMLLIFGEQALRYLFNIDTHMNMDSLHGMIFDYQNIVTMPIYHPNMLIKNEALKRPAWIDLQIFQKMLIDRRQAL